MVACVGVTGDDGHGSGRLSEKADSRDDTLIWPLEVLTRMISDDITMEVIAENVPGRLTLRLIHTRECLHGGPKFQRLVAGPTSAVSTSTS